MFSIADYPNINHLAHYIIFGIRIRTRIREEFFCMFIFNFDDYFVYATTPHPGLGDFPVPVCEQLTT